MVIFINDRFVNDEEANIHVGDLSIQRGYAVFDYFRSRNNIPLFLDDYLDRFYNSALQLGLRPAQSKEELTRVINKMSLLNNVAESGFRILLTGGYSSDSFEPATPNLIIIQQPLVLPPSEKFYQGLKIILHEYKRDLPEIKSTNYLMGIWLRNKVREMDADEVLYFKDGYVLEFPRSNVFIVTRENVVVTPGKNVLKGITRKRVLELARKKYQVEERPVTIEELKNAREVFLTSTAKRILPVLKVDDIAISEGKVGEITTLLDNAFLDLEDKYLQASVQGREQILT